MVKNKEMSQPHCLNANGELENKIKELSLLKSPERSVRKEVKYLGDDDDHSTRAPRSAFSPSPRMDELHRFEHKHQVVKEMSTAYKNLLVSIGEDPGRQGLLKTPERAAKAFLYFTRGYDEKISGDLFLYESSTWTFAHVR